MKLIDDVKSLVPKVEGVAKKVETSVLQPRAIYGWLGGRHWILCVSFGVFASYLAIKHPDALMGYAAAITAIIGGATWRSTSEDRHDERTSRDKDGDSQ